MIRKRLRLDIADAYPSYERRPVAYTSRTVAAPKPSSRPSVKPAGQFMEFRQAKPKSRPSGVPAATIHAARPKRSTKLIATRPANHTKRGRRSLRRLASRQNMLYAMACLVFILGVGVSLSSFHTNRQVAAQVSHQTRKDDDDTSAAPSTAKPSAKDVSSYAVAPNMPRYIDIKKLGVHARVLPMSVTSKNQLRAPGNVFDAGWYNGSALPGQPGAMLVDGHVSSWETNGVFYGLGKLAKGDAITITRGDGKQFTYTVVRNEKYDAGKVDMSSLMVSDDTAKPGLNIITCAGDVVKGTNEFADRQVVYAVQQ